MKGKLWEIGKSNQALTQKWDSLHMAVLNFKQPSSKKLTITLVKLPPNKKLPSIQHLKTEEWSFILEGSLKAELNQRIFSLKKGDYLYLSPKVWHSFKAGSKGVTALSIYSPGLDWNNVDVRSINSEKLIIKRVKGR